MRYINLLLTLTISNSDCCVYTHCIINKQSGHTPLKECHENTLKYIVSCIATATTLFLISISIYTLFYTVRLHAVTLTAVYVVLVFMSVCLSHVGVLLKRLNVGSRKQRHTIDQGRLFSDAEFLNKKMLSPPNRQMQI